MNKEQKPHLSDIIQKINQTHADDMKHRQDQVLILVADLGWDYDRMSSSGQQTYDKLCELLGIEVPQDEVTL